MEARPTCRFYALITGVVREGKRSFWELGLGLLHHILGVWIGAWSSWLEQIIRVWGEISQRCWCTQARRANSTWCACLVLELFINT